ncbi:MAG: hypothetical protein ACREP2_12205 [Rhodanobacteraceae bacterium]
MCFNLHPAGGGPNRGGGAFGRPHGRVARFLPGAWLLGAASLALALSCLAPRALGAADTDTATWVELKFNDGTTLDAQLVSSDTEKIVVNVNGVEKIFPMTQVANMSILDQAPTHPAAPPTPVGTPTVTPPPDGTAIPGGSGTTGANEGDSGGAGKSIAVPVPAVEPGKTVKISVPLQWTQNGDAPWYKTDRASSLHGMPDWTRAAPDQEKTILDLIDKLGDPAAADDAQSKLKDQGAAAVPYEVLFLLDSNPDRAQRCAKLLIDRGDRDVAKYLVEALYATTNEDGTPLKAYLQPYAATLVAGCNQMLGTDFHPDPNQIGFTADDFVTAWNAGSDKMPAQLGEPPYKPDPAPPNAADQKDAWIKFFRTLDLKRVHFVQPAEAKVDLTRKYPRADDPDVDAAIRADIKLLAAPQETAIEAAKARLLRRDWSVVAPYLAQSLVEDKNVTCRMVILNMVTTKADRRCTWHVLKVLVDAWPSPTSLPPAGNVGLIRQLDVVLRTLTGFTGQPAIQPTFTGGYRPVQGFLDFWKQHMLEFPAQYGEPKLDPKLPKYNDYLKKLRTVIDTTGGGAAGDGASGTGGAPGP